MKRELCSSFKSLLAQMSVDMNTKRAATSRRFGSDKSQEAYDYSDFYDERTSSVQSVRAAHLILVNSFIKKTMWKFLLL